MLLTIFGVAFIPSLYSLINIYANWDPYSNTGDVKIAVASRDTGMRQEDGTYVNGTDEVFSDLRENDKIDWQFPDSADEAIEGVKAGDYYAAVVFEDGFTYDLYHLEETLASEEAPITYYSNVKKNAVASKITDMAAETLHREINTEYLRTVFRMFFEDTGDLASKLKDDDAVDTILEQLTETRDALEDFNLAISQFSASSGDISASLNAAEEDFHNARSKGKSDIANAKNHYKEAKQALKDVNSRIDSHSAKLKKAVNELDEAVEELKTAKDDPSRTKVREKVRQRAEKVTNILQTLLALFPENARTPGVQLARDILKQMSTRAENISKLLDKDSLTDSDLLSIDEGATVLKQLYKEELKPGFKQVKADFRTTVKQMKPLLNSMKGVLDDIDPVIDAAGNTVGSLDGTLQQLQAVLTALEDKLNDIIIKVKAAEQDDRKEVLIDLLGGDPDRYADYFSSLVGVEKHEVYSVRNYGSAMMPFYSVIALWVGAVMLVTVLRTEIDRKKFPKATETQGFFGRLLVFVLIGQIQAMVITAENVFLLHCEPAHPWLLWLVTAVISLVFVTLIYALTLAFGDLGRAFVVVIVFLQIAGSSGSYPIEILPEIFEKIYRFFPFPYAVNALREPLCGLYGNDMAMYLAKLLVFFVVAIVIGIFVRRPFIGLKAYVTEKQKETGVM